MAVTHLKMSPLKPLKMFAAPFKVCTAGGGVAVALKMSPSAPFKFYCTTGGSGGGSGSGSGGGSGGEGSGGEGSGGGSGGEGSGGEGSGGEGSGGEGSGHSLLSILPKVGQFVENFKMLFKSEVNFGAKFLFSLSLLFLLLELLDFWVKVPENFDKVNNYLKSGTKKKV